MEKPSNIKLEQMLLIEDIRTRSKSFFSRIATENAGVIQKAKFRPDVAEIIMFGWKVIWVPDFDTDNGFQQILLPGETAETKSMARKGKWKLFEMHGFTEKEFDAIYRCRKVIDKFALCVIKPLNTILRSPDREMLITALRCFEPGYEKWKGWADKHWNLFRGMSLSPKQVASVQILAITVEDYWKGVNSKKETPVKVAPPAEKDLASQLGAKFKVKSKKKSEKVFKIDPPVEPVQETSFSHEVDPSMIEAALPKADSSSVMQAAMASIGSLDMK